MIKLKQITNYFSEQITNAFDSVVAFMDTKYDDVGLPVDAKNLHVDEVMKNWREDAIAPTYQDLLKIKSEQNTLLEYLKIASNSEINKN